MCNNTLEYYYKEAVKKKYEEVKNGVNFVFLNTPTRAKLNNLCWEIFERSNMHPDDLIVFNSLLGFPFDLDTKNKFKKYSNQFRPIETFFKGETDPLNIDVVNMAAILVDFPLRPFNKFRVQNLYPDNSQNFDAGKPEITNPEKQPVGSSEILDLFLDTKENEKGIKKGNYIETVQPPKAIGLFINIKEKFLDRLKRKIKLTAIGVAIILCTGFAVIYKVFPKKNCMHWTGDHYEMVDCDLAAPDNNIVVLDPNQINLKRIKVCDTTPFFKNDKAVVFYARSADSLECFNQIGYHPERRSLYLKPITRYMKNRYISNKPCK